MRGRKFRVVISTWWAASVRLERTAGSRTEFTSRLPLVYQLFSSHLHLVVSHGHFGRVCLWSWFSGGFLADVLERRSRFQRLLWSLWSPFVESLHAHLFSTQIQQATVRDADLVVERFLSKGVRRQSSAPLRSTASHSGPLPLSMLRRPAHPESREQDVFVTLRMLLTPT